MRNWFMKYLEVLAHSWYGRRIISLSKYIASRDPFNRKLRINNEGSLRIKRSIYGRDNLLEVGRRACLDGVHIKIIGNRNVITIGENTIIGKNCNIYLFGNDLSLKIGANCSFSHDDEILVQEDKSSITIGDDCMFSHHINIRTSDAHPIFKIDTGERKNWARDISIGKHVWVTAYVIIQKGAHIGDNCIIGTYSIVNHRISKSVKKDRHIEEIPVNSIIAGQPAKVVQEGIYWERTFK